MNVSHNHSFVEKKEISTLSKYRRRDTNKILKTIEKIAEQVSAIIFDNFRSQNSNITIQIKDVYNAKTKIRKKNSINTFLYRFC